MHRRARRHPRSWRRDLGAVSPVIGTILILFIVLLAMAGIMAWGVPAIQGLQNYAEFQTVVTNLHQLNAEIDVLRTPDAARQVSVSMNQGSLRVDEGSRWVVTGYANASYTGMNLTGWEPDTASSLTLSTVPSGTDVTIQRIDGSTPTDILTTTCVTDPCSLALGTYRVADNTTRVEYAVGSSVKAETWIVDVGRIVYRMSEGDETNRVHVEMGAVFTQQGEAVFLQDDAAVKEPVFDTDPKDTSLLVRLIEVDGDDVVYGKGTHKVLINLENTYGITKGRPQFSPAYAVRLQIDDSGAAATRGLLDEGYCNHFRSAENYTQQADAGECDGGTVNLLYDPTNDPYTNNGEFLFELSHAVVNAYLIA